MIEYLISIMQYQWLREAYSIYGTNCIFNLPLFITIQWIYLMLLRWKDHIYFVGFVSDAQHPIKLILTSTVLSMAKKL